MYIYQQLLFELYRQTLYIFKSFKKFLFVTAATT